MKKYLFYTLFILTFTVGLTFQGCILDAFDTLTQNIPISRSFTASGNSTSVTKTESFSLTNSETYNSYRDKIKKIRFVQAAFRATSTSSPDLKGDLKLDLKTAAGATLFSVSLPNTNPNSYINSSLVLNISQNEIQALDAYLSISGNRDFVASFSISNITGSTAPYSVTGVVDIVFEMTSDL